VKEVKYGYAIQQAGALHLLAQQRTAQLEEVLGDSAPDVSAEWDRADDALGRAVITLRLSDFSGSAISVFEPKELESPSQMRSRFLRLWSDLLQIRTRRQLQELIGGGGTGES
jgi:hypothetical protein